MLERTLGEVDAFAELMREGAGMVPLRPLAVQESRFGEAAVMEIVTADGIITCVRHGLDAGEGRAVVFLVGHSFGGAVAIAAGALLGPVTAGVVALSTQVPGTEHVDKLAGTPLLLVHGDSDGVLPDLCSHNVYERAGEPRELVILEGEGHLLEGATATLVELVSDFVSKAWDGV